MTDILQNEAQGRSSFEFIVLFSNCQFTLYFGVLLTYVTCTYHSNDSKLCIITRISKCSC